MTKESIKKLIAQDHLAEAIEQLMALVNAYLLIHPKDQTAAKIQQALIVNSGKYKGLEQEQVLGILNREDEQTTIAQVRKALLYAIEELPEKVWQSKVGSKVPGSSSLATHASEFDYDLFLSFSSKDREAARLIWETLRGLGYRVFLSDEALKAYAGMSFLDKINSALRKSQHFLLLCTPTAVESHWVKLECETFFTRFHLPAPHERRFFIFEREGKKKMADVYQNLQTLEDLQTLLDLLQTQFAANINHISISSYGLKLGASSMQSSDTKSEQRLEKEQAKLEKAAIKAISNTNPKQNADWTAIRNSVLLRNFYETHSTDAPTSQFLKFHQEVVQTFGHISETELDDLIEAIAQEATRKEEVLNVFIPQTIQTFVADHKGKWNRREELLFLEELSLRFEAVLDKHALAALLEEARSDYQTHLQDFVLIKGGTFTMGASEEEQDSRDAERPQHQVQVSDFYLCKYPVTLAQFEEFILASGYLTDADKDGGSNFWTGNKWEKKAGINWSCDVNGNSQQDKQHPVIHVSWNDAKSYCAWLAKKLNLSVRLPREAEWEYACRVGTTTPFNTGKNLTTEQANYQGNYPYARFPKGVFLEKTSPVGAYPANKWGLYDLHGNVWEWCEDWYRDTFYEEFEKQGMALDPIGPEKGSERVLRGGSWIYFARGCRSAFRYRLAPENRSGDVGFRPAISL